MLGDVLLLTERHHRAGKAIVEHIEALRAPGQRLVVAISGESGSGKSELAHVVAKRLTARGAVAKPIALDNFYRVAPLERAGVRERVGVDEAVGLDEVAWDEVSRVVADFHGGRGSAMPCIDLVTQRVDQLTTNFGEVDVLVLDGLYAIAVDEADLRVFIDLTYHDTGKAQALRGKERQDALRAAVLEREHQVVSSLRERAGLLVTPAFEVVAGPAA